MGDVLVLCEFCVVCGANAWLGIGKVRHEPPDWRLPRGLAGLAGLRADAPGEARGADGERAGLAAAGDLAGLWQAADLAGLRSTPENKRGSGCTDTKNRRPEGRRLFVRHGGLEPSTR